MSDRTISSLFSNHGKDQLEWNQSTFDTTTDISQSIKNLRICSSDDSRSSDNQSEERPHQSPILDDPKNELPKFHSLGDRNILPEGLWSLNLENFDKSALYDDNNGNANVNVNVNANTNANDNNKTPNSRPKLTLKSPATFSTTISHSDAFVNNDLRNGDMQPTASSFLSPESVSSMIFSPLLSKENDFQSGDFATVEINSNHNQYPETESYDHCITPNLNNHAFNIDTPMTPISPATPISGTFNALGITSNRQYKRYPLKDEELESFVLNPSLLELRLGKRIGDGANGFVCSCELSDFNSYSNHSFNIAIKIPRSKSQCKYFIQEIQFLIKLRKYKNEWLYGHSDFDPAHYPFIDFFGIYYLNRSQFELLNKKDELPCILMSKMDMGLTDFIKMKSEQNTNESELKLPLNLWTKLANFLIVALRILQELDSVHCDIKTDNIMVQLQGMHNDLENDVIFKLIDFSSSNEVSKIRACPDITLQYAAPELLDYKLPAEERLPSYSTDIFSCGCVLLEAATGCVPYSSVGYDRYYQLSVIQQGKPLDVLTPEEAVLLKNNTSVLDIVREMVEKRSDLDVIEQMLNKC